MLLSNEILKAIKSTVWFGEESDEVWLGFVVLRC